MDRVKLLSIVLILAVVFSSFGYHYFSLLKENAELVAEHSILRREFSDLNEAYLELKAKHEALVGSFSQLKEELLELNSSLEALNRKYLELLVNYTDLSNNYNSLSRSYQELLGRYEEMRDDYGRILRAFNEPLPYKLKPTISELSYWLKYEDNTDKIAYEDPNFVCGDFGVKYEENNISFNISLNDSVKRAIHSSNASCRNIRCGNKASKGGRTGEIFSCGELIIGKGESVGIAITAPSINTRYGKPIYRI